ncbi:MAG: hypothetical protein GEU88_14970 [Solirubrobacterales bacterium]|nr:hypothetical protein [Solirubrobacterales bacterium]
MRVLDVASGRAGDKGSTLDLTIAAADAEAYARLAGWLSAERVSEALGLDDSRRYELPGLRALKFVCEGALGQGPYGSLRAGMHWQKAAVWAVLAMEVNDGGG